MLGTLEQQAFLIGAALVLVFQAAKFSQLSGGGPSTSRYMALLPGAKVRDFAGPYAYHIGLFAFLAASFLLYALGCQVSPDIIRGVAKLFNNEAAIATIETVPYPLFVAVMFVGLTQPLIPGFAQIGDAQRKFFHDRIQVPTRVIDVSESLINAIESRSASKRRLIAELRKLTGNEFLTNLRNEGDIAFYKQQLEQLRIDDEATLKRLLRESSLNELRGLIERLVLTALVSVMRRSGPKSLLKVAASLGAPPLPMAPGHFKFLLRNIISSSVLFAVALLVIANVLWLLNEPVLSLFDKDPNEGLWPADLSNVGLELWAIVPPIFLCLLVAISSLVPSGPSADRDAPDAPKASVLADLVEFAQSSAPVLGVCVVLSVLIKLGQLFYEYGAFNLPPGMRSATALIMPVAQSFIPVAVSLLSTWYLVSRTSDARRGLSFRGTLLAIAGATGLIGLLYGLVFAAEYVRAHPGVSAGDFVLFIVVANVLVSVSAFATVTLFFNRRRNAAEAQRPAVTATRRVRARTAMAKPLRRVRAGAAMRRRTAVR